MINENDAVATDEIRFGDNDRLAALVSHLVHADALLLLSDVDALYTGPPSRPGRGASPGWSAQDLDGIDVESRGSAVGTGGMVTKLESVAIATQSGIPVVLTSAAQAAPALAGEDVGTWFTATGRRTSIRRLWLAHAAKRTDGSCSTPVLSVRSSSGGPRCCPPGDRVRGRVRGRRPGRARRPDAVVIGRGLVAYGPDEVPRLLVDRPPTSGSSSARATTARSSTATTWSWRAADADRRRSDLHEQDGPTRSEM